ncbi:stage II sporulation protein M [Jatrophihabitans sp. YIM 134969]
MVASFDLDAFVAARAGGWERLRQLATARSLDAHGADELVARYQQASSDLLQVRAHGGDPETVRLLSATVATARAAVLGGAPRRRGWRAFGHGVTVAFPLAVYESWRWWVGTAAANVVVAAAMIWYVSGHQDRLYRAIPSENVRQLVDHDFADYYSANPAQSFAAQVWLNNALVSALGLVLGVTLVGTVVVLWANISNVGLIGGAMIAAGKGEVFFGLILPHGLLELTAVFVATGSGLRLGWAWVAPGARSRAQALAETGRSTLVVALGLVGVLAVSGAVEAFVTPSGLPTWARIGTGIAVELAFLVYVFVLGRRAALRGESADVAAGEREDVVAHA